MAESVAVKVVYSSSCASLTWGPPAGLTPSRQHPHNPRRAGDSQEGQSVLPAFEVPPTALVLFCFSDQKDNWRKNAHWITMRIQEETKSKSVPIPCENDFEISHQNHWLFSFEISKGKRFLLVYSRTSPWYERRSEEKTST